MRRPVSAVEAGKTVDRECDVLCLDFHFLPMLVPEGVAVKANIKLLRQIKTVEDFPTLWIAGSNRRFRSTRANGSNGSISFRASTVFICPRPRQGWSSKKHEGRGFLAYRPTQPAGFERFPADSRLSRPIFARPFQL